jgi:hypothetical protein
MSGDDNHGSGIQPQGFLTTSETKDVSLTGSVLNTPTLPESKVLEENEECHVPAASVAPPFSVYTRRQKWFIITLASFAGLFRSAPSATQIHPYSYAIQVLSQLVYISQLSKPLRTHSIHLLSS